jgi:transposase-like protein
MSLPKIYTDENAARKHLESLLWPDGPICPRCKGANTATKLEGKSTRPGVYKCRPCQKPFSVTVGTVFERSHIPLHQWVYATHLLTASKKGISSHQLMRMLGVTYKTAWFMSHRIREGMRPTEFTPMGGSGGPAVESDETLIGRREGVTGRFIPSNAHKNVVLTLVERGGSARSFHINSASVYSIVPILRTNINRETRLMTDGAVFYKNPGKEFAEHGVVDHSAREYVRGDIHTNTVEGYYSIFKRGMKGIYQHCAEKHLHRYLSEFDFRYTNRIARGVGDAERARRALEGIKGKRLTYRGTN